jgi:hypothetical protein
MLAAALVLAASLISQASRAAEPALPKDGWSSWKVDAVEGSPSWCCWNNRPDQASVCDLSDDRFGYGSRDGASTDAIRIYARTEGGKVQSVRALAASCPVKSKTPIQELEGVATDDSARWLIALNKAQRAGGKFRHDVGEQSLAALAMHRGELAFGELRTLARSDADPKVRKNSIFWIGMLRGEPGVDLVSSVMSNDMDPDVRQHGAFAMSQSKSPRAAAELIRLGKTDKAGDVREKAWFWLAETGAPHAEAAILEAAKKDAEEDVRDHAIFALSQLPDGRATKALVAAAEDRSLSKEQRKKALFWLGQSDEADAATYLDKVLTGQVRN